jgi:hypothetical protein
MSTLRDTVQLEGLSQLKNWSHRELNLWFSSLSILLQVAWVVAKLIAQIVSEYCSRTDHYVRVLPNPVLKDVSLYNGRRQGDLPLSVAYASEATLMKLWNTYSWRKLSFDIWLPKELIVVRCVVLFVHSPKRLIEVIFTETCLLAMLLNFNKNFLEYFYIKKVMADVTLFDLLRYWIPWLASASQREGSGSVLSR